MTEKIDIDVRPPYQLEEERVELSKRLGGAWTPFEAQLFNLIVYGDRKLPLEKSPMYFSKRLLCAQRMLEAYDDTVLELSKEKPKEKEKKSGA